MLIVLAASRCCQSVRNTLVKQGSSTTKKRNKYFFDVDDLANMPFTLWTEDGFIFIHDYMRDQMIFLMLAYCFTGAARWSLSWQRKDGGEAARWQDG
jgi:hypothetical protein